MLNWTSFGLVEGLFAKLMEFVFLSMNFNFCKGQIVYKYLLSCLYRSQILLVLLLLEADFATTEGLQSQRRVIDTDKENILSHSCIHDQILEQRKRPGHKVYSVSAQVYVEPDLSKSLKRKGRGLLGVSELPLPHTDAKQPIRIYLNYDAVGHSSDRDCRNVGDIVKASILYEKFCLYC